MEYVVFAVFIQFSKVSGLGALAIILEEKKINLN